MYKARAWSILFGLTIFGTTSSAMPSCRNVVRLAGAEREAFIDAAYGPENVVGVEVLAAEGCAGEVVLGLERIGASVRFTDDKVSYVFTVVPQARVLTLLGLPGINYAAVWSGGSESELGSQPAPSWGPVPSFSIALPMVATELSEGGPYFPIAEAGLDALWKRREDADGRGVAVAVVDSGIDMLHPALQCAVSGTGALLPKIADISPPDYAVRDTNWVHLKEFVKAEGGRFAVADRTWIAPRDGVFRFGVYSRELSLPQEANPPFRLLLHVGILWDEQANRVWVDTAGDGNFLRQSALGDYAETHDIGFFGYKEGGADNRIPFAVKIDPPRQALYVSMADGGHGTYVAGPLAANRLTGGLFDGAAPNAQLVDVPNTALPLLTRVLAALARSDVAVVNRSGRIAGQDGVAADREDFERRVLERAVSIYNKPVACYCGARNALNVRDYQSPEMLRRNRQVAPPFLASMNTSGSVWFTADGLVNTIFAPSTALVTESRYFPLDSPMGDGRRGLSKLILDPPAPVGYGIGSNPSPTIPVVSGVLADLIGESKREHVRIDAARLNQAIFAGATWVPGFAASEQGFGVVNASRAWEQLVAMAKGDSPQNRILTSFKISVRRPGGLVEVNGFHADQDRPVENLSGEVWVTRRGGYAGGRAYEVSLRGDDGTFVLIDRVRVLTRGRPALVRFRARVTSGLHVAFLELRDSKTRVVMQEVPLSVRAPEVPTRVGRGVEEYTSTIPARRLKELYVHVRGDAQAVRYNMRIPYTGPPLVDLRVMPGFHWGVSGYSFVPTPLPSGTPIDVDHHVGPMQEFESLVANKKAGTQRILWENRGRPEYETPYDPPAPDIAVAGKLAVRSYAVTFGRSQSNHIQVTNKLAEVEGEVEWYGAELTSTEVSTKDGHGSFAIPRTLPPHVAQWRIAVALESGAIGGDVFVLDCTNREKGCHVAGWKQIGPGGALLTVDDAREGEWRVLVRPRDARRADMRVMIREAVLSRVGSDGGRLGESHRSGETWTVPLASGAKYVGFRMRPCCDDPVAKSGLRIAVTPLGSGAP